MAKADSDFIMEHLESLPILRSGVAPGPGWKAKPTVEQNGFTRNCWVSPLGKTFRCLRWAYRFERIVRQLNGDEAKAWVIYNRKGSARKYSSKSAIPASKLPARKPCKTNQYSPEGLSKEAKEFHASASTKMTSQPSQLSDQDESEYKSLWIYYMTPVTRSHEELRSGMILRNKHAKCSLLRSKGSTFRQALHKRILDLEKKGNKYEILNMLREMKRFDMSMQAGEGPSHLVANILGPQHGGDEIEVLDATAISDMQGLDENIENDGDMIDLSSSCDPPSVDLSENLEVTSPMSTIVFPDQEQYPGTPVPPKSNSSLPDLEQNLLGDPTAQCPDALEKWIASRGVAQPHIEVIDLCKDDEDLSPKSKDPKQSEVIDLLDDDEIDEVIVID